MKNKDVELDKIVDEFLKNMEGGDKDGKVPVQK